MAQGPIQGLSIGLGLDTSGIDVGMKALNQKLKAVSSEMKANMSAFDRGEKSVEKYQTQLGGLNKKLGLQEQAVNEARREYEKMVQQHGEGSRQAERASIVYNNHVSDFNNLQRVVGDLSREFQDFQREQEAAASSFGRLGSSLETAGGQFTKVGDGMKTVGGNMTKFVTAPILGIGAGMMTAAKESEDSAIRIQNTLGVTSEEAEKLKEISSGLYRDGFGESLEEVDTALLQTKQNMKDLNESDLESATKSALILANTFDADVNEVTRAGNNLMEGFGIESQEAFDLMAHGAQNGLNFSNEMFDNLSEYSTLFGNMGFSAEEYFQLLQQGSEAGVYNLDYINDVMKEFQIRVKDGSKASTDAMAGLSEETNGVWKAFLKGDGTVKDVSNAVLAELSGMEDQVKANEIGVGLYGTKWEDLEADAMYALGGINGELGNVSGTVDEMGKNLEESFSQRLSGLLRESKASLVPLGTVMLDMAEGILPKVTAGVEKVTSWLENMSPKAQESAVMFAGIAAAAGPLIAGLGFVATSVGGVMTALAPVATAIAGAGGLSAAFGTAGTAIMAFTTGPVGIAIAAVAGIGIATGLLVKNLTQDAIPEVDRFGEGVSESTEKALGGFFDLSDGASQELMNLRVNGTEVTGKMADELVSKFSDMNAQILDGMKKRHADEIAEMETQFANSSVLSSEREAEILRQQEIKNDMQVVSQQHLEDRIKEIIEKAAGEKRALTESEAQQIDEIRNQMNENAVVNLTANETEQKVILERMKNTASDLSAKQAAEVVKNSADQRDKVIADADKTYNDTVAFAIQQRDEAGTISAEEAQRIIDEAKKKRDGVAAHAGEMHTKVVDEAQKQAEGHIEKVDWETGEILSKWDVYKAGVVSKFKATNKEAMDDFKKWGTDFNTGWNSFNDGAQVVVDKYKANVGRKFKETTSESLADFKRWGTDFDTGWTSFNDKAKAKVDAYKANVKKKFTETNTESLADFKRWGGNIVEGAESIKNSAMTKWTNYKNGVVTKFREQKDQATTQAKTLGTNVVNGAESVKNTALAKWTAFKDGVVLKFAQMKDGAVGRFNDLVTAAKNLPGRIGEGIRSMAYKVTDGVKAVSNKLASTLGSGINGVIGGVNWVLGKIGSKSTIPKWSVPKYAQGTKGHHPGGLMVVGDGVGSNSGPELIETPDGKQTLSPSKPTLTVAPKGTKVWSATETKEIMSMIPHYAWGTDQLKAAGSYVKDKWNAGKNAVKSVGGKVKDAVVDAYDYITKPGAFLDLALKTLGISKPTGGSLAGNMAIGGWNKTKAAAVDYVKKQMTTFGASQSGITVTGGNGGGFGKPFVLTSKPGPRNTGIPGASKYHKGWDWAAPTGTPIPSVSDGVVHRNSWHPLSGNFVEIRSGNKIHRYQHNSKNLVQVGQQVRKGQTVGLVGMTGVGSGPHLHYELKGLETGGVINSEQMVRVGEKNREEIMIPMHKSRRTDAMKLLALAGRKLMGNNSGSITRPNQLPNVSSGAENNESGMLASLLEATLQQNQILLKLLQKDSNVYLDSEVLADAVTPAVSQNLGGRASLEAAMKGMI